MEPNKFVLMSDNDVWAKVDLLRAKKGKIAVGKFLNLERSLGFNDNPFGLLQEIDLRGIVSPTGSFTLDWVHIYLNNGIGGSELWCVLERLDLIDVKYDTFAEECLRWRWPGKIEEKGYTGASAAAVFSTKTCGVEQARLEEFRVRIPDGVSYGAALAASQRREAYA